MGVRFERTSFHARDGEVPIIVAPYRIRDHDFDLLVMSDGEWVHVKARVFQMQGDLQLNYEFKAALYHLCLLGNFYLNEVTFSADDEGNVYVEADMLPDIPYEDFRMEFNSLALGIDYFFEVLEKLSS